MTLIDSPEAYNAFYPYAQGGYKPRVYPRRYPCLCINERQEGGLGGDYWRMSVIYLPLDLATTPPHAAFIAGARAEVVVLDEA